jgi:hypothetical protein
MRATGDALCRAVAVWQQGLLDLLPPEIEHGILGCSLDEGGWAILMHDHASCMLPYARFSPGTNTFLLDAMAALHATYLEAADLANPALGLCDLRHVYTVFAPATGWREMGAADEVPKRILEGWALLPTLVEPDVADIIQGLLDDPTPLCTALARYPHTLVHGDWRHANHGLLPGDGRRLVLLDWQLATVAPPAVEMGRCLGTNSTLLPGTKEEAIACYRDHLTRRLGPRFHDDWWQPQLELALLGGFVQDGWAVALKATHWHIGANAREHWRADLQWWSQQVRAGSLWLCTG